MHIYEYAQSISERKYRSMKNHISLSSVMLGVLPILMSVIAFMVFPGNVMAAHSMSSDGLSPSETSLIRSLLPQQTSVGATDHLQVSYNMKSFKRIIDLGNGVKVQNALKRSDLSSLARKIILSIPTQVEWGIDVPITQHTHTSTVVSSSDCAYAATAHGYVQDTDIYGVVLWSYDVKQPFSTGDPDKYGPRVCAYGARIPTFYANGILTWKAGGDTYSTGSLPATDWTEVNNGFFNPGYGVLPGEIGKISFWMYGGGYWDVNVNIEF